MNPIRVPGWFVGILGATCALIVLSFVSMAYFVSLGGLVIAGGIAFMAGTGAAAMVDTKRIGLNTTAVGFYLVALAAAYFLILPSLAGPLPPGVQRGGPAVDRPAAGGSPGVYPPR
jgi:hypothetical protein